jgi:putative endonuclease
MADDQRLYELARVAQQKAIRQRQRKAKASTKACAAYESQERTHTAMAAVSPSQQTGHQAEDQALHYLQSCGLTVLARNLRSKTGEIDLIAVDGNTLVFIEVRQRHSRQYGGAAASVNRQKQARLLRTAQYFLPRLVECYFRGMMPACRFDVVGVEPEGLVWIKDAFSA